MKHRTFTYGLWVLIGMLPMACSSSDSSTDTTSNPGVSVPSGNVIITDEQAATLIGKTESDAKAQADSKGWVWRVGRRDGEEFALTMDYCQCRVTVSIDNDIVTEAVVG
ncbi:MAG: hypothetical protein WC864_04065 [Ilumatobacteraceae bacterium]